MSDVTRVELTWGKPASSDDRSYLFTFDPVLGLKDIDGRQVGIEGWEFLRAPNAEATAYMIADRGHSLEQVNRGIRRLHEEGGFASVVVVFQVPSIQQ
ncbi:MAG: hypothetical protein AAGA15_07795 [Pseudomonadota bacterium]